jgi:hypothetical protein
MSIPLYKGIDATIFPIDPINIGLQSYVYALSKLGYGNHDSVNQLWDLVEEHKAPNETYKLDKPQKGWVICNGKKNKLDKWITLYVLLAYKHRNEFKNNELL